MRPKILMLSFRLPVPLTEGFKIRACHLAKILAQRYTVDLVTFHNGAIPSEQRAQLHTIFRQVICHPLPPLRARFSALAALPTPLPLQVFYHRSSALQRWVDQHYSEYDLVFCVHTRMAQYALSLPTKKVIDLIDASSLLYHGALPYTHGLWHWIYRLESQRLQRYELSLIAAFDKAFVASPYDAAYLLQARAFPSERLVVIPNGVREELLHCPETLEEHSLLFLGKMDYAPNVDAVMYFGREVFPYLRAQDPRLTFVIVGTSPRREVRQLAQLPGVIVTGYVKDPFVYVQRAKVVVAPLRFAAGVQNKVLEALALGKAVVATPPAARWLPPDEQQVLCVASSAEELISVIISLLQDGAWRRQLGERGRQLVCSKYRWAYVGERLLAEIESVLRS
jgi:sugar transferase (PEP-CTERM/EpsH1 system associated)